MTTTAASWFPGPLGRHEFRYWDGQAWTEHVADNGSQATDPIVGPGASNDAGARADGTAHEPTAEVPPAQTETAVPPQGGPTLQLQMAPTRTRRRATP